MFNKTDINELGNEALAIFSRRYKIRCEINLVSSEVFWKYAKQSKLIQDKIKENIPVSVGALVVHSKLDKVLVSEDVLNSITNDPLFVKAIFIHEFYHVYFKKLLEEGALKIPFRSEEEVKLKMKK